MNHTKLFHLPLSVIHYIQPFLDQFKQLRLSQINAYRSAYTMQSELSEDPTNDTLFDKLEVEQSRLFTSLYLGLVHLLHDVLFIKP